MAPSPMGPGFGWGMPAQRPQFGGTVPVSVATTNGAAQAASSLTARSRPSVSTSNGEPVLSGVVTASVASEVASSLPPPAF